MRTSFKPWATSEIAHPFIEAAAKIGELGIKPSDKAVTRRWRRRRLARPLYIQTRG
jgi:hypothetical protein